MMSIAFSVSELIDIAIGIERRGITFDDVMAKSTDNEIAGRVFQGLADMEREHIQIFQDMLGEADKYKLLESSNEEEYAGYLQALVDSSVFTDEMVTSEVVTRADTDIEALELAIGAEKDSILFYYEMRDIMPQQTHSAINRIITEEKSHLGELSELKKKLGTS